ncbi:MAG: hypothetical protein LBV44_06200 [Methylobacillus sp.]|jgi:alpha-tubulin suppressor-like RCC1 family protein|nr:hypothetical protein [Methylobacillus sp.]
MKLVKRLSVTGALALMTLGAIPFAQAEIYYSPAQLHSTSPDYVNSLGDKDAPSYGNQMADGMQVAKVSFGQLNGIALDGKGNVYTWGWNGWGQLGVGKPYNVIGFYPTKAAIPAYEWNNLGYAGGWLLVDFFSNPGKYASNYAAMGIAPELTQPTPVIDVGAGYHHMVALDAKGRVWAWGQNDVGQVGKTGADSYNFPQLVSGLPANIVRVWAHNGYLDRGQSFALTSDGKLWSWGSNYLGKQGIDSATNEVADRTPHQVLFPAGTRIVEAQGGDYHNTALDSAGNVWTWGSGNLGNAGATRYNKPTLLVRPTGMGKVTKISTSFETTLALDEEHNVWQWGGAYTGFTAATPQKVEVEPSEKTRVGYTPVAYGIGAGENVSYFIDQHGRSWAWGWNLYFGFGREGGYESSNDIRTTKAYQFPQVVGDGDSQIYDTDPKDPAAGAYKSPYGTYGNVNPLHPTMYDDKYQGTEYGKKWKEMAFKPLPKIRSIIGSRSAYGILDYDGNLFRWAYDGSGTLSWGNGEDFDSRYAYTGNARDGQYDQYAYEVLLMRNAGFSTPKCVMPQVVLGGVVSAAASSSRLSTGATAFVASYFYDNNKAAPTKVGGGSVVQWGKVSGGKITGTINGWGGKLASYSADDLQSTAKWNAAIPSARNIFTANGSNSGIPFTWGSLTTDPWASPDLSNDIVTAVRNSPLGDILNSQLTYVPGKPARSTPDASYQAFVTANASRKGVVYVGANDGMLHGFDAGNGTELMAYIPRGLLNQLSLLTTSAYQHRYWVDGSPYSADAQTGSGSAWTSVLAGALGGGGRGYFVLNVTKPDTFTETPPATFASNVMMDATERGAAIAKGISATQWSHIGSQFSQPVMDQSITNQSSQIVRINKINSVSKKPEWAVIMGNGYYNDSGLPVLLVQSFASGTPLYTVVGACVKKGKAEDAAVCLADGNGLGAPRTIDVDGNGTADIVYAGDLEGNLWKFNIANPDTDQWKVANGSASIPEPLFSAVSPSGDTQPITAAPVAVATPKGGFMVAFATGKNLSVTDQTDMNQNSVYGVWDSTPVKALASTDATTKVTTSQILLGSDTASATVRVDSPIPGDCKTGTGAGRYEGCLYQHTNGELNNAKTGFVAGLSSGGDAVKYVGSGAKVYGWYYDIPEEANGNMAKVLANLLVMPGNTLAFYSVNVGSTDTGNEANCEPPEAITPKTTINFFDIFSGGNPLVTVRVMINGTPFFFKSGEGNRFQLDDTNTFLRDNTDTLVGVETDSSVKLMLPTKPGRRAGWHIAR